jgi:putative FmdB family regulatory protein
MPIYEYKCPKCGVFETMQRITEPALKRCPTCKSKVDRMISNTSFVLKGSGWYATDYAHSGSGKSSDTSGDKSSDKSGGKPSGESTGNGANSSSSDTAAAASSNTSGSSDKSSGSSSSERSAKSKASD